MPIVNNTSKIIARRLRAAAKLIECEGKVSNDAEHLAGAYAIALRIIDIPLRQMLTANGCATEAEAIFRKLDTGCS